MPLTPEKTLRSIIEAEAVLRALTHAKLEALARWVEALPAYQLSYPDLEVAMTQVQRLLQRPAEALVL